ncbi:MAG: hypothetical protein WBN96_00495 [Gammaproteobacteria bacterium]
MSKYEQQILHTEKYYARAINATAAENTESLSYVVNGGCLSRLISNPVGSGIDET